MDTFYSDIKLNLLKLNNYKLQKNNHLKLIDQIY